MDQLPELTWYSVYLSYITLTSHKVKSGITKLITVANMSASTFLTNLEWLSGGMSKKSTLPPLGCVSVRVFMTID